jgi:hypothetical protein
MRKIILSLMLGAGILGIVGFTPSEANAYWIRTPYGMVSSYGVWPSGTFYMSGYGMYNPYYQSGTSYGWAYTYPASYRLSASYNYLMSMYTSRSMAAYLYNPLSGYSYRYVSPAISGYTINPYYGYRTFTVPSTTYTIPLGYPYTYYYGGYMTPTYLTPYYPIYP